MLFGANEIPAQTRARVNALAERGRLPQSVLLTGGSEKLREKCAMELAGVRPNIKFTTKDDYAIIAMVENGLGVSIVPELLLQGHTDDLRAMELFPGAKRTIALAIPTSAALSPAASRFVDCAREWVEKAY